MAGFLVAFDVDSAVLPLTPSRLWRETRTNNAVFGWGLVLTGLVFPNARLNSDLVSSVELSINGLMIIEGGRKFYPWSRITGIVASEAPDEICTIDLDDRSTVSLGVRHLPRSGDVEATRHHRCAVLQAAYELADRSAPGPVPRPRAWGRSLLWARRHPLWWGVGSGLVVAALCYVVVRDVRFSVVLGAFVGLFDWLVWRPNGPGSRWADRSGSQQPFVD